MEHDTIIVGGGPAGASCGLWLKELGLRPLVIEARPTLGGSQNDSPYMNSWIAGLGDMTGAAFAQQIDAHLRARAVPIAVSSRVERVAPAAGGFVVTGTGPDGAFSHRARTVVAASGVTAERGGMADAEGVHFGAGPAIHALRPGSRVALLGGGDNAFENYGFARAAGAEVTIYARNIRARPALRAGVPPGDVRRGPYAVSEAARTVDGEAFDAIFVFYGYRAETPYLDGLPVVRDAKGYVATRPETAETDAAGVYAIGEIAARMHPCCVTAMADGVVAAKAIEAVLTGL